MEKEVIHNVYKTLAMGLDFRKTLKAVHSELKRELDWGVMAVTFWDERENQFRYLDFENGGNPKEGANGVINLEEKSPLAKALKTGLPVILPGREKDDLWIHQKPFSKEIKSSLFFPLVYKKKVLGTINFGSKKMDHFSENQFHFLHQVVRGLAPFLQNALRFEATKKRLDELTILYEITKAANSSLNLDQMLKEIIKSLHRFFEFEVLGILLLDESTKRFFLHPSSTGLSIENREFSLGKGITGWVVEKGKSLLVPDVQKDPRYLGGCEGVLSEMCVPLRVGNKTIGVLDAQSKKRDAYSKEDLRLFGMAGEHLAALIENGRSEEQYRSVVDSALDGVMVMGEDYRLTYANERLADLLGYSREDVLRIDFRNCLDEESKQTITKRMVQSERGEEISPQCELNILRKDRERRNVEVSSTVIRDSQGNMNTVAFLKDITEKRKMEEQLLQAEKLRAVGEMASGVAHDFNNALAIILGNTQLLLLNAKDKELKEGLKIIEKVARDSAQTVRRLQEFTKSKGNQELFVLDINAIVKDVIEITRPKWKDAAQKKGIHIEMAHHFEEIRPAIGNASELREVITNMIFNAIEAMPQGGKIEIRTFQGKEKVYIQISDTGMGMTEEVRKRVFEPFFTTKPFTNTGLGLSMAYGIIRRFGGEINIESKVGQGTTFMVSLPIGVEGKEELNTPSTINIGRKARILVIDDEVSVREILLRILTLAKHQVVVAKSGEEGIRLFQEQDFDIVLTDLGMPGMSGWEVGHAIKRMNPHLPVAMITGWGTEVDQEKVKENGLDFIISKPFDFHKVLNTVAEIIESRRCSDLSSPLI